MPSPREEIGPDLYSRFRESKGEWREEFDEYHSTVHRCTLPEKEDVIVHYIQAGWCIMVRRKVKSYFMANEKNPRTRLFLRSRYMIMAERARHLQWYYYTVHPFSDARKHWEMLMLITYTICILIIPFHLMIVTGDATLDTIRATIDTICLFDIIFEFFTGYYQKDTQRIILDLKMIARHYAKTYFILDLIPTIPLYRVPYIQRNKDIIMVLHFMDFFRIFGFFKYIVPYKDRKQWSNFKYKIFKTAVFVYLAIVIGGCFVFICNTIIAREPTGIEKPLPDRIFKFIYSCYRFLSCIFMVEYGDRPYESPYIIVGMAIAIQLGFLLNCFVLSNILQIISRFHRSSMNYDALMREVDEYVRYNDLPKKMLDRLYKYMDYKFEKQFYDEDDIINTISPQLKEEITIYTSKDVLERVEFFRELPVNVLFELVKILKTVIYLPNDIIVQAGYEGDAMYFINYGTVAVYTKTGQEICHLSDGNYFGEISLLCDDKRIATVVAVGACELLRLSKADFNKLMGGSTKYLEEMRMRASQRIASTASLSNINLYRSRDSVNPFGEITTRRATMMPKMD